MIPVKGSKADFIQGDYCDRGTWMDAMGSCRRGETLGLTLTRTRTSGN